MRIVEPWDTTFMEMARTIAKRSKDPSTQCGAVVVGSGHRVLGLGFNGPPPQLDDRLIPWLHRPSKLACVIHAEENAIDDAREKGCGDKLQGSTLYVTAFPCPGCVLRMIRAGIHSVIYDDDPARQPKMCDDAAKETVLMIRMTGDYRFRLRPYSQME